MSMPKNVPFKFWCHKILPLVYDDSLSYYEFLCKVNEVVQGLAEHDVEQDEAIERNAENIQKNADDIEAETRARDTAIANEESARIRGDYELGVRLDNDEFHITDLHNQIRWVAKKFGALPYDAEHSYNVGDFCLFNDVGSSDDDTLIYGEIYRCKEDTTGEFDNTKWELVNLLQFVERIWTETLEPFANKYDEDHTWNVDDIVLYGGDELYGNTGGMPVIYRCINQTTGAFNYEDWTPLRFSWILDKINSSSVDMTPLFDIIAHTFNENDIYNSGNVVKKENANSEWVLYKCNDDGVTGSWDDTKWDEFYPANIEISGMQLYDLCVGNKQRSTQNATDIRELDTFFNSCIPLFLDKSVDASYPTQNFPKFSLCRTTNSPAPYAHVYYCTSDTDNTSFDSAVWVEIENLQEWISAQLGSISRYSEIQTANRNSNITEVI